MKNDEEFFKKLDEATREASEMHQALFADAHKTAKAIVSDYSQTNYRHFVRAVMAYVEGMTFRLKESALTFSYLELNNEFDDRDKALLREEQYVLDQKGNPRTKKLRLPMKQNIKFAIHTFAKAFDLAPQLDTESTGWKALVSTIEVRHRLTHPKKVEDLTVTKMEADLASTALWWFFNFSKALEGKAAEVLKRRTEEMENCKKEAV